MNTEVTLGRRVYTVAEIARMCGVATDSIYRALKKGLLKPIAGFGKFMISEAELQRFLNVTKW